MKLLIRADAYPELGTGHLMRCFALAEGARDAGSEAVFLTYCTSPSLLQRIKGEGFELIELQAPGVLEETLRVIGEQAPSWVVLDGYHFDTAFQRAVRGTGSKVLVYDDYCHLESYECDIIVNQNLGAEDIKYSSSEGTTVLAGSSYVVLRKDFLDFNDTPRRIPEQGTKLLVTLGGADFQNHTVKVLMGLGRVKRKLDVRVVLGAANKNLTEVRETVKTLHHAVKVLHDVPDMQRMMEWADLAISAGGTTSWEVAYMGLPAVFTVIAENQQKGVDALERAGYPSISLFEDEKIDDIGSTVEGLLSDLEKRQELSNLGRRLVDGKGINRILSAMESRPLRVLFLGGEDGNPLAQWLRQMGEEVHYHHEKLTPEEVITISPDIIVSYKYRYILKGDVLNIPPLGAINLHISYLPYNRGSDPNPWSIIDNTPKGVTIHYIDEGVDTGDIIYQAEVSIEREDETLKSSYESLCRRIQELFKENWKDIRLGRAPRRKQEGKGTYHRRSDNERFRDIIDRHGWDISISRFIEEAASEGGSK